MFELFNKVALVTGGANGIGEAIVRHFLLENTKFVAILDIDENNGSVLETELETKHGKDKAKFYKCDVTVDDQLFGTFKKICKEKGCIDVVVNNAGIADERPHMYKREIDINYTALVSSTLKAVELMRKDRGGKGGTIINVSSICALYPSSPTTFIYAGAKSAVLTFSYTLGMEGYYSRTNVRVITVCFGVTQTNMIQVVRTCDDEVNETINERFEDYLKTTSIQSCESAGLGVVEAYRKSTSNGVWLITNNKCSDISDNVKKSFEILSEKMFE